VAGFRLNRVREQLTRQHADRLRSAWLDNRQIEQCCVKLQQCLACAAMPGVQLGRNSFCHQDAWMRLGKHDVVALNHRGSLVPCPSPCVWSCSLIGLPHFFTFTRRQLCDGDAPSARHSVSGVWWTGEPFCLPRPATILECGLARQRTLQVHFNFNPLAT
jgi:hypothetical protein